LTAGRLSVVLPNFNHAALLPRALAALAAQARRADEILLLDDASTDDSVAVAEGWRDRLPELRIIRQPKNVGVVENLRRGLAEATGEYLYMGASDDAARPALFARGVAALEAHPRAAVAAGEARLVGPGGESLGLRPAILPSRTARYLDPAETAALYRRADHIVVSVATVWRRAPMLAAGGLDPAFGAYVDSALAREMILRDGFVFIPEVLGTWHVSPGGVSRSLATRPAATIELVKRVRARMERLAGDPYPAWYPAVFERRARFAAARLLVTEPAEGRIDPGAIAAILDSDPAERAALALAARLPGGMARLATLGWLTLRHRPMSLAALAGTSLDRRMRPRD
jgi:glycosyltransferase involved in cell wall biosynthesis